MELLDDNIRKNLGLPEGVYIQSFLLGMEAPFAIDPISHEPLPWKLHDHDTLARIAKTAIGMPYVEKQDGSYHVAAAGAKETFELQKKYSWGEMVDVYINPDTGNANAIWKPFDEYKQDVLEEKFSPFTSPMLYITKGTPDDILDAQIIHLHGVPNSGFPPEIASIKSMCIGGLQQCMTELKSVAASGGLKDKQNFSYNANSEIKDNMGKDDPKIEDTIKGLSSKVVTFESDISTIKDQMSSISEKLDSLSGVSQPDSTVAAGGKGVEAHQGVSATVLEDPKKQIESLKNDLKTINDERKAEKEQIAKERAAIALDKRKTQVKDIVEYKLKLKRIDLDKKDDEFKRLLTLKDEDSKELKDLSLLHDELKEATEKIVAAAGDSFYVYPEMTNETEDTNKNYFELVQEIG